MYREVSQPVSDPDALNWDLADPGFQIDPYQHYRWLRDEAPVHRLLLPNGRELFLISRYDDVREILMDAGTYSSVATQDLTWLAFKDPPDHTRVRRTVSRALTDRAIAALDPEVERLTTEFFAYLLDDRGGNAVKFANLLPVGVIAVILGIPTDSTDKLARWSLQSLELLGDSLGIPGNDEARRATAEFIQYLKEVLAAYYQQPADNIGSNLVQFAKTGDMSEEEVLSFAQFLFVAGHETTTHSLSSGLGILAQDPALFERLKANRELVPPFIEEVLRYRTVLQALGRIATRDVEIGGVKIPQGSQLRLSLANANLDESIFPDAETFDIERDKPTRHMTFGKGIHTCVGAPLARREMRIGFEHVLNTVKSMRLDPAKAPVPHVGGSTNEHGWDELHVLIEPEQS